MGAKLNERTQSLIAQFYISMMNLYDCCLTTLNEPTASEVSDKNVVSIYDPQLAPTLEFLTHLCWRTEINMKI